MIRRAGHAVDDPTTPAAGGAADRVTGAGPLGSCAGLDLDLAAGRIAAEGGDETAFRNRMSAALAGFTDPTPDLVLALAALAGWRCGVLRLREDALHRLSGVLQAGAAPLRLATAGVLGLPEPRLAGFLTGQRHDRFAWPLRPEGAWEAVRVGGFTGLGGPWPAPPVDPAPGGGPGRFLVRVAERSWLVDADVFAHRVRPVPDDEADRWRRIGAEAASAVVPAAELVVSPLSHLARIVVGGR